MTEDQNRDKLLKKLKNVQGKKGTMTNRVMNKDTSTENTQKSKTLKPKKNNLVNKTESYRRKYLLVVTCNLRGTIEKGELKHFIREVKNFRFHIVALQETKQLGQEMMENEGALFFFIVEAETGC